MKRNSKYCIILVENLQEIPMTSLENKVLQCASGEKRLNPDELRQYFGTYEERVVLAVLLEKC